MKNFLDILSLRPSRFTRKTQDGCSGCDLIIEDYRRIDFVMPDFDDEEGLSAVLVYNKKKVMSYLLNKDLVLRKPRSKKSSVTMDVGESQHQNL